MTRAVRVHETGGPEVLRLEEIDLGDPGPGEALVRHTAIGVNFIDTYFRSGLYPAPAMPFVPGAEAAGIVEAVGHGVTTVAPGDRVAYVVTLGAYSDARLIAADRLVRLPDDIADRDAAAMVLKGMTVRFLLRATYPVRPETVMLVHAAAGGVGLLMGQWARHLGVGTIIGTVGGPEKAALAAANGYTHVIDYRSEDFVARVKDITGGRGVDVAYDSVGKDTFPGSLDCLRPRGLWVSFGNASGPVPPFQISLLSQKGSLYATRPTIFAYIATRADLEQTAQDLFDVVRSGAVTVTARQELPLADVAEAHRALEGRRTSGATVLIP
ncbi:quinone oxidoreductase [Pseudoxanthobacter sp. M-2]|uniref:quinone oxidoreductase family protein n=1 Tax=Pseudoxanthobacter sp. M-2 TaxID=3078754 RepID=UPI0038FD25CA